MLRGVQLKDDGFLPKMRQNWKIQRRISSEKYSQSVTILYGLPCADIIFRFIFRLHATKAYGLGITYISKAMDYMGLSRYIFIA